ncbi:MAG: YchJ family metal-binding protein [Pedobacter sp.]
MTHNKNGGELNDLQPADLVLARCDAFRQHDFSFIFHSYHEDAPFLQAFADCRDYLEYAAQALKGSFRINDCRIGRVREVADDEVQVLFFMEIDCDGVIHRTIEMACLKLTAQGWRYHSAAKRPLEDFDSPLEDIDFDEFLDCATLVFF